VYWRWFLAIPAPVPESYWPWLYPLDPDKPQDIMQFSAGSRPFERDTQYVDVALARRPKGWVSKTVNIHALPSPLQIGKQDGLVQFIDSREYLAHVLGAHGYEEMHAKNSLEKWYNGTHLCDIIPDTSSGSRKYVVLFNVRNPAQDDAAGHSSSSALPELDERVSIVITLNGMQQSWTGRVIRIPGQYTKMGRNVAILAEAPPYVSGRVDAPTQSRVDVYFGHHGSPASKLRESIIEVMTTSQPTPGRAFFRQVFLAHDNHSLADNEIVSNSLPADYQARVNAACTNASLNAEQI